MRFYEKTQKIAFRVGDTFIEGKYSSVLPKEIVPINIWQKMQYIAIYSLLLFIQNRGGFREVNDD